MDDPDRVYLRSCPRFGYSQEALRSLLQVIILVIHSDRIFSVALTCPVTVLVHGLQLIIYFILLLLCQVESLFSFADVT